jgi:hypothetical protein
MRYENGAPMKMNRRDFLSTASLGGAAAVLSPLVGGLVNEAMGQVSTRKLALFYVFNGGFHPDMEFLPDDLKGKSPGPGGVTSFRWPSALAPLEPFRSRTLLIDGLNNHGHTDGHVCGYAALSCRTDRALEILKRHTIPAGITIDQYIAETLGKGTSFSSVRFGSGGSGWKPIKAHAFAFGKDKPADHILDPVLYHRTLFGKVAGGQDPTQSKSDTLLLDAIRGQIKRVQARLAGPEREKLDVYLGSIAELEKRQSAALKCGPAPKAPAAVPASGPKGSEDLLEAMMSMSLVAAICGMTNVICVCDGHGSHGKQTKFSRIAAGTELESAGFVAQPDHDPPAASRSKRQIVRRFQSGLLAGAIRTLSGVKVGDKTLFDDSTMLFMSENADDHHSKHQRWPLLVIGNAGGKLRADGRFLGYSGRALADLFSAMATALGRPTTDFGKDGTVAIQGPLGEVLA